MAAGVRGVDAAFIGVMTTLLAVDAGCIDFESNGFAIDAAFLDVDGERGPLDGDALKEMQ